MENKKDVVTIRIQLPIEKCGEFNKNSEEIRDVNLTDEEFVTLVRFVQMTESLRVANMKIVHEDYDPDKYEPIGSN